ncbi:uncharacterized protein L969DRAFT_100970 [Mixia osmundae IAM 14324]|uniref:N-acetyltransferase ECO1 n=1 Tax=Mixia osmundae (strain CBS 9802 / IAM 14324 / JCM 22182 / KY 12970) TaxID=764103 RepID=G7E325_MIXOS|nr:uncharacterized protein L969DRAFT_100970 [Mixia osmundae IAM 14324]KEI42505.1 hypothetical protein L969DRAFT_100970 [Mixia osmundae IAM 14324]GAA97206.1 hypothetical protein E5Q_03882 [Mixia osmundae IAM 14324]
MKAPTATQCNTLDRWVMQQHSLANPSETRPLGAMKQRNAARRRDPPNDSSQQLLLSLGTQSGRELSTHGDLINEQAKDTVLTIRCTSCGLLYARASSQEKALHQRYCSQSNLHSPAPGSCRLFVSRSIIRTVLWSSLVGDKIVEIDLTGHFPRAETEELEAILSRVDMELGSPRCDLTSYAQSHGKMYAYLIPTRQSGPLELAAAITTTRIKSSEIARISGSESSDIIITSDRPDPTSRIGIQRMVAMSHHRRKGHVTRLIDLACKTAIPYCPQARTDLAFSQPTRQGAAFILAYLKATELRLC